MVEWVAVSRRSTLRVGCLEDRISEKVITAERTAFFALYFLVAGRSPPSEYRRNRYFIDAVASRMLEVALFLYEHLVLRT